MHPHDVNLLRALAGFDKSRLRALAAPGPVGDWARAGFLARDDSPADTSGATVAAAAAYILEQCYDDQAEETATTLG